MCGQGELPCKLTKEYLEFFDLLENKDELLCTVGHYTSIVSDRLFREYHYGYENRDYDVLGYDFPKDKNIPYKIELDEEATDKTRDLILRLSSGETSWEEFQQMKKYWDNLYMDWTRDESGFGSGCEKKIDYKEYCGRFDLTNKKTKICAKITDAQRREIMRILIVGVEPVDDSDLDDLEKFMLQKLE